MSTLPRQTPQCDPHSARSAQSRCCADRKHPISGCHDSDATKTPAASHVLTQFSVLAIQSNLHQPFTPSAALPLSGTGLGPWGWWGAGNKYVNEGRRFWVNTQSQSLIVSTHAYIFKMLLLDIKAQCGHTMIYT